MIRQIVSGFLHGHDPIIAERWYYRYHCKEVVRAFGPWLRRYETYKTLPPPPQAERFGVRGGFLTELWYANLEDYVEAEPYDRKWTPMPPLRAGTAEVEPCHILVPARPTEDFLGREPAPEEGTIVRWFCVFRYPQGVSNAFLLCPVFAFLYPIRKARLGSLAASPGIEGTDDRSRVANLLAALDELKAKVGIPLSIKDSGLEEQQWLDQIDQLAARDAEGYYRLRPNLKDANDDMVFECAANFGAEVIVTHNVRDFTDPELKYQIAALRPGEFIRRIRSDA